MEEGLGKKLGVKCGIIGENGRVREEKSSFKKNVIRFSRENNKHFDKIKKDAHRCASNKLHLEK
jgi:hypothetical protein